MIHKTNTENKIDFPDLEKTPDLENPREVEGEYKDPLTRLKEARERKKEIKKTVKTMTEKFGGNSKMAKKVVKTAVRRIVNRKAGRGR
jgi:RNA binding exosome subunit